MEKITIYCPYERFLGKTNWVFGYFYIPLPCVIHTF